MQIIRNILSSKIKLFDSSFPSAFSRRLVCLSVRHFTVTLTERQKIILSPDLILAVSRKGKNWEEGEARREKGLQYEYSSTSVRNSVNSVSAMHVRSFISTNTLEGKHEFHSDMTQIINLIFS